GARPHQRPTRLGRLRRSGHHDPRGARGRPQAPGHVHRLHGPARAPSPRLRGGGQLRGRGARGVLQPRRRHDPPRLVHHGDRRRARHPGLRHGEGGQVRPRGGPDRPARRRQVRRGRGLQGLGRPARRRRLRGQRAVGVPSRGDPPRRLRLAPGVRPRRAAGADRQGRALGPHGHHHLVPAGRRGLRDPRLRVRRPAAAPARDGVPDPRPADHARRRAWRGQARRVPRRGRHRGLRAPPQRRQGDHRQEGRLLRVRGVRGLRRGRDAVERDLPGVLLLLRQQHQHARGRLAHVGLPLRADRRREPLGAREGRAAREGSRALGRGRARGAHRGPVREAHRPAVRGPDEDEARQPGHAALRPEGGQREARRVPRGEPRRRPRRRAQGRAGRPGPLRRAQGARPHAAQERAGELAPARQAGRLLREG
ncbi:MAG: DNA gyrase subunit B, partial [uncultured Solirubrobacteraceae bacterium]